MTSTRKCEMFGWILPINDKATDKLIWDKPVLMNIYSHMPYFQGEKEYLHFNRKTTPHLLGLNSNSPVSDKMKLNRTNICTLCGAQNLLASPVCCFTFYTIHVATLINSNKRHLLACSGGREPPMSKGRRLIIYASVPRHRVNMCSPVMRLHLDEIDWEERTFFYPATRIFTMLERLVVGRKKSSIM